MATSQSIKEISTALSKAQGELDHAKKDMTNNFYESKYADLASVIDAAKKQLSDNGLSVTQIVDYDESGTFLETILMHSSGEWISGKYPIRPLKADPQSVGSALTYARRYAFSAITGIAADDDDANAASAGAADLPVENEKNWYNDFDSQKDMMKAKIASGERTAKQIIANLRTTYKVSKKIAEQIEALENN